jgi:acyl-CoA thioesterase II
VTDPSPLLRALDLRQLDADLFAASPLGFRPNRRTFGGQVAAQSLRAATRTIESRRHVHSLHSYFIRPGRPEDPLYLAVARTRDGRAFSTRHVAASQGGKPIFEMIASFHDPEPGEQWQSAGPPAVPPPRDLDPAPLPWLFGDGQSVEIRPVAPPSPGSGRVSHPFWLRVTMPGGAEPALHACLLTYLSDLAVVSAARPPQSTAEHSLRVSLDHAIWFHRPSDVGQWLLYGMSPVTHFGARGLAQGSMWTEDGTLIASVAQEVLLRS